MSSHISINKDTVAGLIAGCKQKGFAIWINAMWPELCGGQDDDRKGHDQPGTKGLKAGR